MVHPPQRGERHSDLPAASMERSWHELCSPNRPVCSPLTPAPSNNRVLPEEPLSVPESTLLTSGAPAAPPQPELGHPSGRGCLPPRGLAGPPVLLQDALKGRLQDLGAEGKSMLVREGKKELGLGCAGSEGPPRPDPESRVLMSRPHSSREAGERPVPIHLTLRSQNWEVRIARPLGSIRGENSLQLPPS